MKFNQNNEGFRVFLLKFKATTAIDLKHIYKIHPQSHGSGGKARRQSRATVPLKNLEKTSVDTAWVRMGNCLLTHCLSYCLNRMLH